MTIQKKILIFSSLLILVSTTLSIMGASYLNIVQTTHQNKKRLEVATKSFERQLEEVVAELDEKYHAFIHNQEKAKISNRIVNTSVDPESISVQGFITNLLDLGIETGMDSFALYFAKENRTRESLKFMYNRSLGGIIKVKPGKGEPDWFGARDAYGADPFPDGKYMLIIMNEFGFFDRKEIEDPAISYPEAYEIIPKSELLIKNGEIVLRVHFKYTNPFSVSESENTNHLGFFIMEKPTGVKVATIDHELGVFFTLYNLAGKKIGGQLEMPGIDLQELQFSQGKLIHLKDESDNQYDSTLATLKYKATPIGRLSVNIPKSETTRKVFETIGLLIIIASAVLICMLLITIGVVERFSQPILDLTESASEIASGNLEVLIDIEREDELGSLAQSFAFMRDAIKENITEIKEEIEERKKAEESLRTSERELNSIIKNTPDIIFRLDPDGRITFISDSVKKYGYAPGEMIGRDFFKLVHPGDRDRTRNRINERRTGNRKTTSLEIGFLAKDQSTARVESAAKGAHNGVKVFLIEAEGLYSAEKSATDNFLGTQGIARDITARKRAQEDKLALERRLQRVEKDESLSRMASAVAHHFNNMLAVTIGNLEMAMENLPLGTDLAESLDEAQKAARSAAEMSGLMLTFLGQSWGKPKLLDLSDFCRRQLTRLRAAMPPDVHLETELLSPGPVINADPAQLRQVLSALFTNAWEAMNGSAGEVRVSVDTVEAADIPGGRRFPVKWAPSAGARARLAISDTGRGMDAETVNRIFDPFYTDKFTGRGLGLAVTLGIVKGCNGAITVESEPDRGSTFQVFLPLSGERVPRPEGAKAIETQYIAGETVLLVENNEAVRNMAKVMLERIGFKILTARDGPEAVEIFRENREDIRLVISDLSMPGMDGWETLDLLRSIRPDIPVILVSDNDEALVMAEDHPEQPQAFMHKPFRMKTLKEILGRVLGCERAQGP